MYRVNTVIAIKPGVRIANNTKERSVRRGEDIGTAVRASRIPRIRDSQRWIVKVVNATRTPRAVENDRTLTSSRHLHCRNASILEIGKTIPCGWRGPRLSGASVSYYVLPCRLQTTRQRATLATEKDGKYEAAKRRADGGGGGRWSKRPQQSCRYSNDSRAFHSVVRWRGPHAPCHRRPSHSGHLLVQRFLPCGGGPRERREPECPGSLGAWNLLCEPLEPSRNTNSLRSRRTGRTMIRCNDGARDQQTLAFFGNGDD